MPDGAHEKVNLNVRVTPTKKEEWKGSLDDDENLSSLVRRAVDREINHEYIPKEVLDDFSGNTGQADIDLSPVLNQLGDLERSVTSVEHKIDTISVTQADEGENKDEDIEELAMDLLLRLPTYPNDIPEDVLKSMDEMGEKTPREFIFT
jgi:hypothetical protein